MTAFLSILFQIVVMLSLIICGVFLYKKRWISTETNKQLSNLLILFVNPVLMFYSYNVEMKISLIIGLLQALFIAIVSHMLFIIISKIIMSYKKTKDYGIERYCCIYSNCAFIGIPLVSAVYGMEGVFYITAYITVFNLLMWSHGIILLNRGDKIEFVRKILLSPTIIATLAGILVFVFQIKIPELVLKPLEYIANMNTPLAMIVSGVIIAQSNFRKVLKNIRVYVIAIIKLLLIPIIVLLVFNFKWVNHTALLSTILVSGCPVATSAILLAIRYQLNEKYAAEIFGITTIMSAFTLPIIVLLGELM